MTDVIDPTTPNYTAKCVALHQRSLLQDALSLYIGANELPGFLGNIEARITAELAAEQESRLQHRDLHVRLRLVDDQLEHMHRVVAELKVALEKLRHIEDAFRDEPGFPMLGFRRWFMLSDLGLDCEQAALDAMAGFMIQVGQETLPAFTMAEIKAIPDLVLSLREAMMDYLTFPNLSRYELANIARAQLGLLTINGSVPQAWHGLSFRDMVRAHLGLITVPAAQPALARTVPVHSSALASLPN